ncbi:MAG: sulfotransferase [Sulfurifustis sp.]
MSNEGSESIGAGRVPDAEELQCLPVHERADRLAGLIRRHLGEVLHRSPASINDDTPFAALDPAWTGLAGVRAFFYPVVKNVIEQALKRTFYRHELFKGGTSEYRDTIRQLATYLAETMVIPAPTRSFADPHEGASWGWVLPTTRPSERVPPIALILSSPRSGSTLLRAMLAGHPDLMAPPELHLLMFESMAERKKQLAVTGCHWMSFGLIHTFEMAGATTEEAAQRLAQTEADDVPIPEFYRMLQQQAGGRTLVDKSTMYSMHPAWLQRAEEVFDDPKYLHLTRHPYAVIESFVRLHFHKTSVGPHFGISDENAWLFAEKWWAVSYSNSVRFLETVARDRQYTLRYEDLVTDPEGMMREVCAFLNIPFHSAVLDPYAGSRKQDGLGDPNLLTRNRIEPELITAWRERRPPLALSPFTRRVAQTLGYDL